MEGLAHHPKLFRSADVSEMPAYRRVERVNSSLEELFRNELKELKCV